jgi:hypothetical protein
MSPQEHQLSQEVLEFLIAQQDWFMLDIPPPPESSSVAPNIDGTAETDDFLIVPSSDEDNNQSSGTWKLVGKDRRKLMRRKTEDNSKQFSRVYMMFAADQLSN